MNKDNILEVVMMFNSAPSAHAQVKSIAENRDLTDDEITEIYEYTEGYNDSETERLLKSMSDVQTATLISELKLINDEHKDMYGDEYDDFVGGADIDSLLS